MALEGVRVRLVHPDLGLGGAERLVVDAALELRAAGADAAVYTASLDDKRCFAEVRGAGWVVVAGDWVPRHVLGRGHALCAALRTCVAAAAAAREAGAGAVYVLDQVAAPVLLLRWLLAAVGGARTLFYCHFPDALLAPRATGALRRAYRAPLDALEERATGAATEVVVNSAFTAGVFARTFKALARRGVAPAVLHPAVALPPRAAVAATPSKGAGAILEGAGVAGVPVDARVVLSINRFERKKGLPVALRAFAALVSRAGGDARDDRPLHLVFAGGYDARLVENVEHLEELREEARALGLERRVSFVPSFSDAQKVALLAACVAVVYTPQDEHFGIVPLEAMAAARPVVACDSGGPRESVVHGSTGYLCEPTPQAFADALSELLSSPSAAARMGRAARRHVEENFSRSAFGAKLVEIVRRLAGV